MLPADPDAKIVWACFIIARHREGLGVSAIVTEARRLCMPMTRDDVLEILRRYVDRFDNDVRFTRGKSS